MDKEYAQYLLRKTKDDYNGIADGFSSTRWQPWAELRFLNDYNNVGEKILDLGCGNGRFYELFKEKQVNYYGLDNSEKLIEIAKRKYPQASFIIGDALKMPFADKFFDKIFSIAVFHNFPSQDLRIEFLNETKKVLKPGGLLILTVWNFHQLQDYKLLIKYTILKLLGKSKLDWKDIFKPWANKIERYFHWFSRGELKKIVEKAGFTVNKIGIVKNKRGNRQNIFLVAKKPL